MLVYDPAFSRKSIGFGELALPLDMPPDIISNPYANAELPVGSNVVRFPGYNPQSVFSGQVLASAQTIPTWVWIALAAVALLVLMKRK